MLLVDDGDEDDDDGNEDDDDDNGGDNDPRLSFAGRTRTNILICIRLDTKKSAENKNTRHVKETGSVLKQTDTLQFWALRGGGGVWGEGASCANTPLKF